MKKIICAECGRAVLIPEHAQSGYCIYCGAVLQAPVWRAQSAIQAGDFAAAKRHLRQALEETPGDYEANFLQGMILAQTTDLLRREFGEFCQLMQNAFDDLAGQEDSIQLKKTLEYTQQLCDYAQAERAKSDVLAPGEDELVAWRGQICRVAALYHAAFLGFTPAFLEKHPEYAQRKAELAKRILALCGEAVEPIWYVQKNSRGREEITLEEAFGLTPRNCAVMRRSCMDYLKISAPAEARRLWEAPLQKWLKKAQRFYGHRQQLYRWKVISAAVVLVTLSLFAAGGFGIDSWFIGFIAVFPSIAVMLGLALLPSWFVEVMPVRRLLKKIEELVEQEMEKK